MAGRGRQVGQWLTAGVLALLGVGVAVLKPLGLETWNWLVVAVLCVAAVVAVPGKLALAQLEWRRKRRDETRQVVVSGALREGRVRVGELSDPVVLGVHRAVTPHGTSLAEAGDGDAASVEGVPVYVPRDRHEEVVAALKPGGFVLLVGDSAAGKSRLAFEAAKQVLAGHRLYVPEPSALTAVVEEAAADGRALLWLDDLERFLTGDGSLTATMLDRLLHPSGKHSRVVVATLRLQEQHRLDTDPDSGRTGEETRRRVLAMATRISVDRAFTSAELDRARRRDQDPRIAEALAHTDDYGLAEYLAAGPQLLQRWHDGRAAATHPRGAALVTAAVECRRAGYLGPLPRALLTELHTHYLPTNGRTRPESTDQAWEWATTPWRATTALLEPHDTQSEHVTVFDYLVDHTQRTTPIDQPPPDQLIHTALTFATPTDTTSIGHHAHQTGRYHLAHTAFTQALAHHTNPEHLDTLASRNNLAGVLSSLGRLEEAETEHRAVLEISTRVLGPEHPSTLTSRNNLAGVLSSLGRLEEAEAETRAVLEISTRVLGPEHPSTMNGRNNLAGVLYGLGRFEEAETEHRAVLEIYTRMLGPEHPSTLTSRNNVALVLYGLGQFEEAEAEYRAVLEIRTRVLGPEHPSTLTSRNSLAHVLGSLGRLEEAETELRAVLEISTRVLGPDHPSTLISRNNVALVLYGLGRLEEAEAETRAVLEISTRVLGPDHPSTLTSRNNLAGVLNSLGRLEEAETEHRAVLEISTRVLGPEHPSTMTSRNNLANVLHGLGRLEETEAETRAVLEISTRMLGSEHPSTLTSRNNLAGVLNSLGRLEEAETELRAVLKISTRVLGPDHPSTMNGRNNLVLVLYELGQFKEAEAEYRAVLDIYTRVLGPDP